MGGSPTVVMPGNHGAGGLEDMRTSSHLKGEGGHLQMTDTHEMRIGNCNPHDIDKTLLKRPWN